MAERDSRPLRPDGGIAWPPVPRPGDALVLGLLARLERTQWQDEHVVRRHQGRQLAQLAGHALATVPFYRRSAAELRAITDKGFSEERWRRLPILRREDAQAAGDAIHTTALPAGHGPVGEIFTSGSTGRPLRALRSSMWGNYWRAITMRDHLWQRRDLDAKLAVIRDSTTGKYLYPEGGVGPSWGNAEAALGGTGPAVSLNLNETLDHQVEWLVRQQPAYLLTLPSNAEALATHCRAAGVAIPSLRQVITIAEMLTPDARETVHDAWGVGISDIYSTREVGYLALQCPAGDGYHVQSEVTCVEVIDERGRPVKPGEVGRVIVTPLQNFAMPLLRYDVGDQAELGGPCSCGRKLPVLKRILGRTQRMIRLPSGERLFPLLSSGALRSLVASAPVKLFQLVQKSLDTLELRVVVERDLTEGERNRLRALLREKYHPSFRVEISVHDTIERTKGGKFLDFVSELPADTS